MPAAAATHSELRDRQETRSEPTDLGSSVVARCPLCHAIDFARLRTPERWIGDRHFHRLRGALGLVRCRGCSLVFTSPRPTQEHLRAFYDSDVYECHLTTPTTAAASKAAHVLGRVERYLPAEAPRTLLDYGAGGGTFLLDARTLGWTGWAFEPGRRGLQSCRDAGLPATATLDELPRSAFGLVTLNHVLEHIADPAAALASLRPLLAPGGRVCVEVPNAGSLRARLARLVSAQGMDEAYRAFPIHLMYYTARTLRHMLAHAGWTVEATFTMGVGLDELYLHEQPGPRPGAPGRVPRRARPSWRRFARDMFLSSGLGENLVAIARPLESS